MAKHDATAHEDLKALLNSQRFAVLATAGLEGPYTSLVAFVTTEDLKHLAFVTGRSTQKYANLSTEPRVSMLIDDRTNEEADLQRASAVTALGRAREANDAPQQYILNRFLSKHPSMIPFASSYQSVLIVVDVERYLLVRRFQHITEILP